MPLKISFADVSFAYGEHQIFRNLLLELPNTRTVFIKGENGLGKSTLVLLAGGLLSPQHGEVLYNNKCIWQWSRSALYSRLSILRQRTEHNILGVHALQDLKLWLLSEHNRVYDTDVRLNRVLNEWDLASKKELPVWELSAGELKRLALAGISLFKQRYWILDEPLVALDEVHRLQVYEMIKAKKAINPGMLIISHYVDMFLPLADEVYTIKPGGILMQEK